MLSLLSWRRQRKQHSKAHRQRCAPPHRTACTDHPCRAWGVLRYDPEATNPGAGWRLAQTVGPDAPREAGGSSPEGLLWVLGIRGGRNGLARCTGVIPSLYGARDFQGGIYFLSSGPEYLLCCPPCPVCECGQPGLLGLRSVAASFALGKLAPASSSSLATVGNARQ